MTKSVRLDEEVYETIKANKRADETFSEAIERLVGGPSLLELAGILTEGEATDLRAAIERSRETWASDREEIRDRFDAVE